MAGEGAHYGINSNIVDVLNIIYQITPEDTPVFDAIGDAEARATFHEWQNRSLTTRQDNAQVEGGSFTKRDLINTTRIGNITQIFRKVPTVTETTQAIDHYAIEDMFADQMEQNMAEFKTDMEHAYIQGTQASGSATDSARRLDGFLTVISTNASNLSGATLTEDVFNGLIDDINTVGGKAQDAFMNGFLRRRVSTFTAGATKFMDQNERKTIRPIAVYESEFFVVTMHYSRDMPNAAADTHAIMLLDVSQCKKAWLRRPKSFRLPKTADSMDGVIIGESTLVYGNEASHGLLTNAS